MTSIGRFKSGRTGGPKLSAACDRRFTGRREEKPDWGELRAASSPARPWRKQGDRWKAHNRPFPVYDWFTEGFDTADPKDAKALLEELK